MSDRIESNPRSGPVWLYRISLIIAGALLVHGVRDLLQYLQIDNFFTRWGHQQSIELTNIYFRPFHLSYRPEHEIIYAGIELTLSLILSCSVWIHRRTTSAPTRC